MKRRDFIETTLAGLGVASSGILPSLVHAGDAAPLSTDPIAMVQLTPEIRTSRVGLGTGVHGGGRQCNLTRMDHSRALDIIRFSYDNGVRFFDMADMYGSHQIIAEALADKPRDSYALGTKIWCHPRGGVPEPERPPADQLIERFLKELNTDYIDLIQIHCLTNEQWETQFAYQFEPMEDLKKRGLIRAHGVSCHSLAAANIAAANPWVDAMHVRLNNLHMNMDGTWDDNAAMVRKAKKNGKGIVVMKVLGEGKMKRAEERKSSIDAVVRLLPNDLMVVGFEQREHVTEFLDNVSATLSAMAGT